MMGIDCTRNGCLSPNELLRRTYAYIPGFDEKRRQKAGF